MLFHIHRQTDRHLVSRQMLSFGKISQWGFNLLLWLLNRICFRSNKPHKVEQRPLYLIRLQNTHFLCSHFVCVVKHVPVWSSPVWDLLRFFGLRLRVWIPSFFIARGRGTCQDIKTKEKPLVRQQTEVRYVFVEDCFHSFLKINFLIPFMMDFFPPRQSMMYLFIYS